jgi:CRISPR-associated protein Csy3
MSKNTTPVTTPSVLAFERKLDPSDAMLYAGNWDARHQHAEFQPIVIREKSVRGTISNRMKGSAPDPAKFDADIQKPNLQTVDVAALPSDADTLKMRFTLRILGQCGKPTACNRLDYQAKLVETLANYRSNIGFGELALRYAYNLANGRTLWRNRASAEQVEVQVRHLVDGNSAGNWTFNALELSTRDFDSANESVGELANVIEQALSGEGYTLLEVISFARMGNCQEVFPSQELILDKGKDKKSKTLYDVAGVAALHSQKIGNAIRTIDSWYESDEDVGPIAIEPYGSVTSLGKAFRQPKQKLDFYSLLDDWMTKDKVPALEQQHFVIANLIRGGVYGEAEKA